MDFQDPLIFCVLLLVTSSPKKLCAIKTEPVFIQWEVTSAGSRSLSLIASSSALCTVWTACSSAAKLISGNSVALISSTASEVIVEVVAWVGVSDSPQEMIRLAMARKHIREQITFCFIWGSFVKIGVNLLYINKNTLLQGKRNRCKRCSGRFLMGNSFDFGPQIVVNLKSEGFQVFPRKRIMKRTLAWLDWYRDWSLDSERKSQHSENII